MKTCWKAALAALSLGFLVWSGGPASADVIQTFNSTDGTATFDVTTTGMTITLTDTFNPVDAIAKELDGLLFTLSTNPAGITLTNVSPAGKTDCSSGTCIATSTGTSPFGWAISGGNAPFALQAGGGSFHPWAIVNGSVDGSKDGVSNGQHNPLLLGPVVFSFTWNTLASIPSVTGNVTFEFGTTPATETGTLAPVPEPATLLLLGSGLMAVGVRGRRYQARAIRRRSQCPSTSA